MKNFIAAFTALILLLSSNNVYGQDYEIEPVEIPILMYHHISEKVTSTSIVTPEKLESDFKTLKEEGYEPIFLSDLKNYLEGRSNLPEKPIIITFDDGYLSNYIYAYPISSRYGFKINISIIGWSVGKVTFVDSEVPITPHFDWNQATKMVNSGLVEIQNHTYNMHSTPEAFYGYNRSPAKGMLQKIRESDEDYKIRVMTDIARLNDIIESNLGATTHFVTYPYGAYSEKTENILKDMGIAGTLTTTEGIRVYSNPDDLYKMPRINVTNDMTYQKLIDRIEMLKKP